MSGLDNSQDVTDEQALKEGDVKGKPVHEDRAADQLGKDVAQHAEDAQPAQQ